MDQRISVGKASIITFLAMLAGVLLVLLVNIYIPVSPDLRQSVPSSGLQIAQFEQNNWTYLLINGSALLFPFLLSFDKKVAFYKHWPALFPAIVLMGAFFIVWDVYFTHIGVWGFNEEYTNLYLLGLPLGEWLFFVVIPYCCIFVYECLVAYFPGEPFQRQLKYIDWALMLLFFGVGLSQIDRFYTGSTWLLSGILLALHVFGVLQSPWRGRFYQAYLVGLIPFLLVNGVLTGAFTQRPVVIYTDAENLSSVLGQRILSIPFDDVAYYFLMLLMSMTWYKKLGERS